MPHPGQRIFSSTKRALKIFAVFYLLLGLNSAAFCQQPVDKARLETIRIELQQLGATLERKDLGDKDLTGLRSKIEPIAEELRGFVADQTPKSEAIKARLEQLGPKLDSKADPKTDPKTDPKSLAAESVEVQREREDQEKQKKEIDDSLKIANFQYKIAEDILSNITERRRSLFARALMQQNSSLVSPAFWLEIGKIAPSELRHVSVLFVDWWSFAFDKLNWLKIVFLLVFVALVSAMAPRLTRFVYRFEGRADEIEDPGRLAKALTALRVAFGASALPAVICFITYLFFNELGLIPDRYEGIAKAVLGGVAFLFAIRAIGMAVIPITKPNWRVFGGDDQLAVRLQLLAASVATVLVAGHVIEEITHAVVAPLIVSIAIKGLVSVIVAIILLKTLQSLAVHAAEKDADEDCFGPSTAPDAERGNWIRLTGWAVALTILVAAATGYVALASFVTHQIVWVTIILILLALVLILVEEALGKGMSSDGTMGRRMRESVGLRSGSVNQIGILLSGILRLVVIVFALFLILAPWGIDSGDLTGYLRAGFFGFQVAGVTISLSTIATAIFIFVLGLTLTRGIQGWLETRYLPFTGLDLGLRNSIKTIFGYIGIFIAAALAFSEVGLSLDKLTIVAGALSVGIGFGLQSIVNNFVSGLILLWERPLRVGDWIAIGTEEGIVKKINVRATEIETFDKASLIVPNSEFISGRVKNWVHSNRYARITIPISVKNTVDPKQMEKLLREVALAHREVLSQPQTQVFFMKITDVSVDFELRCFVDVDAMGKTRSELLFAIYERLQQEGIEMPSTTRTVEFADMDGLGAAIAAKLPPGEMASKPGQIQNVEKQAVTKKFAEKKVAS